MVQFPDPFARFMFLASVTAFNAHDHGTWELYERLKAAYLERFPEHDPKQYDEVVGQLARMAGV